MITCIAIGMTACSAGSSSTDQPSDAAATAAGSSNSDGKSSQELPTSSSPPVTREVAHFYLDSGKVATFTQIGGGEDTAVLYEEIGPETSAPTFATTPELEALDMFLALAPADTAVPRALIQSLDAGARDSATARLGSRKLVDAMATPILATPSLALRKVGEEHDTGGWNCSQGASDFENFACDGGTVPGTIEYCDSGQWWNLQRSSGDSKRRKSFGLFVACGTDVQIKHSYADCCNWWELDTKILPSSHWMWSRYTGAVDRRRRVNYDRVSQFSGSYLRAYTAFYD